MSDARGLAMVNREPRERTMFVLLSLLNAIIKPFTRRDWRDRDRMPQTGGVVIVANHISNVDPLVLAQYIAFAGRWPRYLAKASLFRIPVVGRLLRACGQIPVERESRSANRALTAAVDAVERGRAVVVYPEGTITADEDLWPMRGKTGAGRIALETGCPVIPVGQWGAQEIMYGKRIELPRLLPRKTLRLITGDPVPLDDLRSQPLTAAALHEATTRIMDAITALVAMLRQQAPPEDRYDPREPPQTGAAP